MKLFAARPINIRDAESTAVRDSPHLDWTYVEHHLTPLAEVKEDPEILLQLARLRHLSETL